MKDMCEYTYEEGEKVGFEILSLIEKLQPELSNQCATFVDEKIFSDFISRFSAYTPFGDPLPCIIGMFSKILKTNDLKSNLITLWGIESFWDKQTNISPICEISPCLGFIQFASWAGKTDGDAWILDMKSEQIAALSIELSRYDENGVRNGFYSLFQSPWKWLHHLRCDAWEREWI